MRMRLLRRLVAGLGLTAALVGGQLQPAGAAVVGEGVVTGAVRITSAGGVDLSCHNTTFVFGNATVTGTVNVVDDTSNNAANYTGSINVGAIGGGSSGCETTITGSGNVGGFGFAGNNGVCTISGSISGGTYARVGPIVVVLLVGVTIRVDCPAPIGTAIDHDYNVEVVAGFAPAPGQNGLGGTNPPVPTGNSVTDATFAGSFTVND